MGLKGFINRISGGSKEGNAFCFVFGPDRRFFRRKLWAQASHLQDDEHRLAGGPASDRQDLDRWRDRVAAQGLSRRP